jgi:hypothetical protein
VSVAFESFHMLDVDNEHEYCVSEAHELSQAANIGAASNTNIIAAIKIVFFILSPHCLYLFTNSPS